MDGQHRLLALRIAIKGLAGLPGWIAKVAPSWNNLKPHPELAKEEISVIFVEHRDTSKIRKIFNKVNRYAKLTSRSDNIITSDDDIFAVIARKLIVEGEPLAPVNDIDLVISVGGDGTFNEIVSGNLKRNKPLVLSHIPVGTTNDLRTLFGYGRDILKNIENILKGKDKQIDICILNDKPFVYVYGFGKFVSL